MEAEPLVPASCQPGAVLANKYRVERVLGFGGMGVVVAATHMALQELVAIKLLHPEVSRNPVLLRRFFREARACSRLESEHAIKVRDVVAGPAGVPMIVMEHLEGRDLEGLLSWKGRLSLEEAVTYLLQACDALAEAHSFGIIHRDLKPANLFAAVRRDGSVRIKVLDFGISKLLGTGSMDGSTQAGTILGTPFYMSPEQLSAPDLVDERADIWSLGVILYHLITGQLPFEADSLPSLCLKIVQSEPTPLSSFGLPIPPGLDSVLRQALAKDREQRFQTVAELCVALEPFAPSDALPLVQRIKRVCAAERGSLANGSGNYPALDSGTGRFSAADAGSAGFESGPGLGSAESGAFPAQQRSLTPTELAVAQTQLQTSPVVEPSLGFAARPPWLLPAAVSSALTSALVVGAFLLVPRTADSAVAPTPARNAITAAVVLPASAPSPARADPALSASPAVSGAPTASARTSRAPKSAIRQADDDPLADR